MIRRLCPLLLIAALPVWPASKEILDLQRDVAQLQEQIRQLVQAQSAQTQQLTALTTLVQQSLDAANRADKSVAVIQSGIERSLNDQKNQVVAPVVGLSTRMDQVSNDVRTLQQAVADLTSSMSKMQSQLTDINNAIKVLQAPPPPPPGQTTSGPGGMATTQPGGSSVPPMPATDLWHAAENDRNAGKLDLALQEYADYIKYYGTLDLAGNAQYYIGWIHYSQQQYDVAANDFDAVLEKYPDSNKTLDAHYYKGMSLEKSGKRTQGAAEFKEVISENPRSDLAQRACGELKSMGLSCPTGPARTASGKKKRD